ncbi:Ig-like domain-containing protein [Agromyces sp. S2-1-8]|uniref:Ig-like domain-containing protein n=1 Tax=Agromyces sp. S2-1-8 TaxID=2897180 RepID=UPI001E657170|nr:Ig-like domain-containing protein [Agromyces sp. S2-1-8]MCD5344906.1 Ig-like domain-containing protein [Agromyces sp. S2-1-8]
MTRSRRIRKRTGGALIAAAAVAGCLLPLQPALAMQTTGTAPYLNQWLVSGPFTVPVIQGTDAPTAVLGHEVVAPGGAEKSRWQYFDDRIFNRNYDDYNDLMGYFDVKQGQPTVDKWVLAATHVYSPTAQTVQWQLGGSGVYSVFANDEKVGAQTSVPGRVSKSGTRYAVQLKAGWNELVIQIQHKNPGASKNFLGFYSRISDANGNTVPGLTYSASSSATDELEIVTRGLDVDKDAFTQRNANVPANDYPANVLPYGYDENPYVAMTATLDGKRNTSGIAPQASAFTFQAAGGAPGYEWKVTDGELPPGLTLAADGSITGTVKDGAQGKNGKDYAFTVKVTDADGATATRKYTITVKENPVDWFIDGKMSALSHTTGTMPNLYDPNYNYDEWARTAKEMGMTMLSTESLQNTVYYWPSPNANLTPNDGNKLFKYGALEQSTDGAWQVKDRVQQAKDAAERYGMKFGVYVSSLYEGREILESDIQNLVARYDPWYLFADGGPESYSNTDIAWSSARNYNDRVLIDANPNAQTGDQDITLHERPFWNAEPYNEGGWVNGILKQGRKVAHEEWNDPYTTALDVWTQYAKGNERDDWREATKELINQYGHGYVMNYDSSITVTRGMDNLSSNLDNTNIFSMVPISSQQLSDMRQGIITWMDNRGGPDLRESLYGTTPYTLDYERKPGWFEDPQKAIAFGQGPDWGYAMARDQYVYLHLIENQIKGTAKSGLDGAETLQRVGPFTHDIAKVEWLNKGRALPFTTAKTDAGYYVDIDTSSVRTDPIDTVIKVTTKDNTREYRLSSVKVFSSQQEPQLLKLRAESYMNGYTNVLAPAKLTFTTDNPSVASPSGKSGVIHAGADGTATITVTATYDDGVNAPQVKKDTYPVIVRDGAISPNLPLTGIEMSTGGARFWKELDARERVEVGFTGYTEKGGGVDVVSSSKVTYHYATVDGRRDVPGGKIDIREVPASTVPFSVADGELRATGTVDKPTMYAYWADITVNGKTFTASRNFVTVQPDANAAAGLVPEVTTDAVDAKDLSDGVINDASGANTSRWRIPGGEAGSITYDLKSLQELSRVNVFFDHHMPNADNVTYTNAPQKLKIEYSKDGTEWTTGTQTTELSGGGLPTSRNTKAVPKNDTTLYGWEQEGNYYDYPVDPAHDSVQARYVRVSFPEGGQNGSPVDVLEVRIGSLRDLTALGSIRLDAAVADDAKTAQVEVEGRSFQDAGISLDPSELSFESENPDVATIDATGRVTAVAAGRSKITATADHEGYRASSYLYVNVDAQGRISLPTFLTEVSLKLSADEIRVGAPVVASLEGTLNTGDMANLSKADISYEFGDSRLKQVPGSDTIVLGEPITGTFTSTVEAVVELDGVTIRSGAAKLKAAGDNLAGLADVTVSSVRDRTGDSNGNNQDPRYVGTMAIDDNRATTWAAKKADAKPSITLRFPSPIEIDRVNLVDRGALVDHAGEGLIEWEGGSKLVKDIRWDGQPDNLVKLDSPVTTSWMKFTIDPNQTYDNVAVGGESGLVEFQVYGPQKASTVVDTVSLPVDTTVGSIPMLPAQVDAVYSDGSTKAVAVEWEPISEDDVAKEGWFTVTGTIAGSQVEAEAVITVARG